MNRKEFLRIIKTEYGFRETIPDLYIANIKPFSIRFDDYCQDFVTMGIVVNDDIFKLYNLFDYDECMEVIKDYTIVYEKFKDKYNMLDEKDILQMFTNYLEERDE